MLLQVCIRPILDKLLLKHLLELVGTHVRLEDHLSYLVQLFASILRRESTLVDHLAKIFLSSMEELCTCGEIGCSFQVFACLAYLFGCQSVQTTVQDHFLHVTVELRSALVDEGVC